MEKRRPVAFYGMAVALALMVSYVEMLIPFSLGIPGAKLGLTNIVVVLLLYLCDTKTAAGVSGLRIVLAGFLFGNLFGILYGLAGGILSLFCMHFLKKTGCFGIRGVSMAGGVAHNLGQLIVAVLLVKNISLFYYMPFLCLAGAVTGYVIGVLSEEIRKRIDRSTVGKQQEK